MTPMTFCDMSRGGVPFPAVPINAAHIDQLVAAGKYADAARAASKVGAHARAAELYERIWEFADAARAARAAGDTARALRNAIDARDEALAAELVAELTGAGDDGLRAAVDTLAARRRFAIAAPLAEQLGEREQAIDFYKRGNLDLDAARLLEEEGRDREAGRLLERVIEQGDDAPAIRQAHLRLGLLLARRMQHDEAVRHLQEAARHDDTRARARRALVVELVALGLRDAARDVLALARNDDPTLPSDVDALVQSERSARPHTTGERDLEIVGGRYRLERLIGAGASGRVFRARDEVSGHRVAIKLLNTEYARGRQLFERFVREAGVASALRHPNIVEVYDFSAEAGYTVMELMPGGSLRERLDGRMPETQVVRMASDILGGLEQAHQRGVIHRDIKPANIFFDARGTAKLGDFGVAHLLDLGQTQTGGLIGTLAYMAPEQITGARLTITADLYALGVTLFEALTGRLPFLGPDFVAQHLGEVPPPVSELAANVSPAWDPIIERLLAKDPSARFDSVDELRRAIAAIDLGDAAGPKPLILPRGQKRAPTSETSAASIPIPGDEADEEETPRYHHETPLGRTEISTLSRALDTVLNRSVVIERFDEEAPLEDVERRLQVLARGGGPFLQRSLGYDRPRRTAVYEAPAGSNAAEAFVDQPLRARAAIRLLKRLARALAPLHETGDVHGALDATRILLDDHDMNPTVLVAGLGPAADTRPADDVAAVLNIVTHAAGAPPSGRIEDFVDIALAELSPTERGAILSLPVPTTGEELYAFADAIEIALLKARRRARKHL